MRDGAESGNRTHCPRFTKAVHILMCFLGWSLDRESNTGYVNTNDVFCH